MTRIATAIAAALLLATPAPAASPYGELAGREIKALSEAEIADLLAGRGMGMALPAELNAYPGPRHVLDLAGPLDLTEAQRGETERLFADMQLEAVALGGRVLAGEAELERLFADRTATPERLRETVARLAALRGELRYTHLRYHLATRELLTESQLAAYARHRGYGRDNSHGRSHGHSHGN